MPYMSISTASVCVYRALWRARVPRCSGVVEGKGATLFGYRVYMHRQIRIPLSELKYTVEHRSVEPQTEGAEPTVDETLCILDPQSLQNAISVRISDIKVISIGNIPPLPMPDPVPADDTGKTDEKKQQ